jgi:GT2 family glycosyltransferase
MQSSFPNVNCIVNSSNAGFAKANNQAIKQTTGRYVVLLNSDTVMTPSALETLIYYMDATPDVAICGGQLLNSGGSLQNSIANTPTLATELLNKSILRRLYPRRYPGKETRFDTPVEVESIIGACMVVSRDALQQVGMLDEKYFFFFEETDWCLSMRKADWKVCFNPHSYIYHLQGASAKKNLAASRIEYWKSRYTFFNKHYTGTVSLVLRIGLIVRLIISIIPQIFISLVSNSTRSRLKVNVKILIWHILGCNPSWGISHV